MERAVTISLSLKEFKEIIRESIQEHQTGTVEVSEDSEILNQKEAAEFLGISQTTIIKWKKEGKIPYQQIPGSSKVRFYKSQLRRTVQRNPHLLQAARN
ncbi:helix-turn-helix domain-containing protein [Ekhidna sp.]|uniref:helix-turn-helix domain-containing protein n=1 Tax=Ekhidna sp. TaxID=2608089 RepID=UPI00329911D9